MGKYVFSFLKHYPYHTKNIMAILFGTIYLLIPQDIYIFGDEQT